MTDQTVRPKRNITLSSKLRSGDNAAEQELTSHRSDASLTTLASHWHLDDGPTPTSATTPTTPSAVSNSTDHLNPAPGPNYTDHDLGSAFSSQHSIARKRSRAVLSDSKDTAQPDPAASDTNASGPHYRSNEQASAFSVDQVDDAGFLKDIDIIDVDDEAGAERPRLKDRIRDINSFFTTPFQKEPGKKYRNCEECTKKQKRPVSFVNEVTTLRRHMEAAHKGAYLKWAEDHTFTSMLPKDTKRRKLEAKVDGQTQLDSHLRE
ncbi:hypothetical protein M378DRAFT_11915, partial [Amanita muscaria Koide BX008]